MVWHMIFSKPLDSRLGKTLPKAVMLVINQIFSHHFLLPNPVQWAWCPDKIMSCSIMFSLVRSGRSRSLETILMAWDSGRYVMFETILVHALFAIIPVSGSIYKFKLEHDWTTFGIRMRPCIPLFPLIQFGKVRCLVNARVNTGRHLHGEWYLKLTKKPLEPSSVTPSADYNIISRLYLIESQHMLCAY